MEADRICRYLIFNHLIFIEITQNKTNKYINYPFSILHSFHRTASGCPQVVLVVVGVGGLPPDQLLQEAGVGPHPGSDGGHVGQRRGQGAVVPATQHTAHEETITETSRDAI